MKRQKFFMGKLPLRKPSKLLKQLLKAEVWAWNFPKLKLNQTKLKKGIDLLEFLTENKLTSSKSEARRTIANNGLKN